MSLKLLLTTFPLGFIKPYEAIFNYEENLACINIYCNAKRQIVLRVKFGLGYNSIFELYGRRRSDWLTQRQYVPNEINFPYIISILV